MTYRKRFAGSLLLSVQYRMHPSIAAFASAVFYDGLLSTPSSLGSYRPFPRVLHQMMPCVDPTLGVRFINVGGRCNEKRGEQKDGSATVYTHNPAVATQESTSYQNHAEAVRVVNLIKQMKSNQNNVKSFNLYVHSQLTKLASYTIVQKEDLDAYLMATYRSIPCTAFCAKMGFLLDRK